MPGIRSKIIVDEQTRSILPLLNLDSPMISERRQIAERFLSEGNGEAARIRGNRVRDLNKIQSEAYRKVEEIRGVADAKAAEIYARAYNQSPEAVAFYEFTRTMQSYKSIVAENTTLVLSTGSDLFKFLKDMSPDGEAVPAKRPGDTRNLATSQRQ